MKKSDIIDPKKSTFGAQQKELKQLASEHARLRSQTQTRQSTSNLGESTHHSTEHPIEMASSSSQAVLPYFADKIETNIRRLKGNNRATWKRQILNVL